MSDQPKRRETAEEREERRRREIEGLMESMNRTAPKADTELLKSLRRVELSESPDKDLSSDCKTTFLDPLVADWSSLDPEAASKLMDELGDTKSNLNSTARNNIAYNWGTLDPQAALAWACYRDGRLTEAWWGLGCAQS